MIDQLKRPDVQAFIKAHENDDPAALVLASAKYPDLPIKLIANQIKARKKAKTKLPEFYNAEGLIYPQGVSLEQSSSEQTAKYKAGLIEGTSLTDLTGGFGIDSFYFSKVFDQLNYVEQNQELAMVVRHNFGLLEAKNISVNNQASETYLQNQKEVTEWYFLDPARRDDANQKVFQIEDCTPDLNMILPKLIELGKQVLIKLSPMLDIHLALEQLPNVKEVHVVSVNNECKELLFWIDPNHTGEMNVRTVNLKGEEVQTFDFVWGQEPSTVPDFSFPENYLYEPNASIMKAGGVNTIAKAFGIKKLHRNSHLYTSEILVESFPGRAFEIKEVTVLNKKKLKSVLPNWKANITVRNYPESVADIRKKMKIKEGGDVYLFATTLMDGEVKVLVCEKH